MLNDRHLGGRGSFMVEISGPCTRPWRISTPACTGAGLGKTLHSNSKAGFIHHVEHDLHALVFLAEEVAYAIVLLTEIQGGCGRSVDSQLMFNCHAVNVVVHEAAVFDPYLGQRRC